MKKIVLVSSFHREFDYGKNYCILKAKNKLVLVFQPLPARASAVSFTIGNCSYVLTGFRTQGKTYPTQLYLKDNWEFNSNGKYWTRKKDFPGNERFGATGFSIGEKGYIGLGRQYTDFWEYTPSNDTWVQKANFPSYSRYDAVGFSIGNKGYIGMGWGGSSSFSDFWEFDPEKNTWTQKANYPHTVTKVISFSISDKGYVGGGTDNLPPPGTKYYSDFWEFDPSNNKWTRRADNVIRVDGVGFAIGNRGYQGLGRNEEWVFLRDFWEYNPEKDTWVRKADFPGEPRISAVGFSVGGKGYVGFGVNSSGAYLSDFWEYDPLNDVWTELF